MRKIKMNSLEIRELQGQLNVHIGTDFTRFDEILSVILIAINIKVQILDAAIKGINSHLEFLKFIPSQSHRSTSLRASWILFCSSGRITHSRRSGDGKCCCVMPLSSGLGISSILFRIFSSNCTTAIPSLVECS